MECKFQYDLALLVEIYFVFNLSKTICVSLDCNKQYSSIQVSKLLLQHPTLTAVQNTTTVYMSFIKKGILFMIFTIHVQQINKDIPHNTQVQR